MDNEREYKGVIISQFIVYMQVNGIWPCHQFIGDDPQPLTAKEVINIKNGFKQLCDKAP